MNKNKEIIPIVEFEIVENDALPMIMGGRSMRSCNEQEVCKCHGGKNEDTPPACTSKGQPCNNCNLTICYIH